MYLYIVGLGAELGIDIIDGLKYFLNCGFEVSDFGPELVLRVLRASFFRDLPFFASSTQLFPQLSC